MSIHDETWDRPICNICKKPIKYGKSWNHGDGVCGVSKAKSSIKFRKEPRPYSFFYHYNKPMSRKFGRNKLTIHRKGVCHLVDEVRCLVETKTKDNKTQPHCVIIGKSKHFTKIYMPDIGKLVGVLYDLWD